MKDQYEVVVLLKKNGKIVLEHKETTSKKVPAEIVFNDCVAQFDCDGGQMEDLEYNAYDDDGFPCVKK